MTEIIKLSNSNDFHDLGNFSQLTSLAQSSCIGTSSPLLCSCWLKSLPVSPSCTAYPYLRRSQLHIQYPYLSRFYLNYVSIPEDLISISYLLLHVLFVCSFKCFSPTGKATSLLLAEILKRKSTSQSL